VRSRGAQGVQHTFGVRRVHAHLARSWIHDQIEALELGITLVDASASVTRL
jgi:hypothetical protein